MFVYIPAEAVAVITFPGVVLHEVSHRLVCDIFNIPVYSVNYFSPSKKAGHVIHAPIQKEYQSLLVSIAPLIINTIVCMILTLPAGMIDYLGTEFLMQDQSGFWSFLYGALKWIGYTIGFNAMPSDTDMHNVASNSTLCSFFADCIRAISAPFNISFLGPILSIGYAYIISLILPALYWHYCY